MSDMKRLAKFVVCVLLITAAFILKGCATASLIEGDKQPDTTAVADSNESKSARAAADKKRWTPLMPRFWPTEDEEKW